MNWRDLVKDLMNKNFEDIDKEVTRYNIYPGSLTWKKGSYFFISRIDDEKKLVIVKKGSLFDRFEGRIDNIVGINIKLAPLDHKNAVALREVFPYTAPVSFGREETSIGLGDRLGIATPGHIDAVRDTKFRPVFAQQSIRELELTGRSFEDVLDDVSWSVFQEGYEEGFAADGDHLKSKTDIGKALAIGFSMLTLDCTDYIDNGIENLNEESIKKKYSQLSDSITDELEGIYLDKVFTLSSGHKLKFNEENYFNIVLVYNNMIEFTKDIYNNIIKPLDRDIDFEISIDETTTPTTPEAHYFVASELKRKGIHVNSLAPRFCGEFQKGIDYIGDLDKFEDEFKIHSEIADNFGYKLSIHSGSDKFSVFPIIGKYTGGRVHVKTAGTNWLEAVKIIALNAPQLYREIHEFALDNFQEAKKYYHVTTDIDNIPDLAEISDQGLPGLLKKDDVRQLMHITYGLILQAEEGGRYVFKDRLYQVWNNNEAAYREALKSHIGRHIEGLGI